MRRLFAAALAALAASPAWAQTPPHIAAALADPGRPAEHRARDAARKPAELLALAEVEPGDKVVDLVIGGGYLTRLLAAAVGPDGEVTAYQPAEFIQFEAQYGRDLEAVDAAYGNVTGLKDSLGALDLPDGQDLVVTVQNYHDFHLNFFPKQTAAAINAEVFAALKPGGVYLIVDHEAVAGSGVSAAHELHRIDVEAVKSEVAAAGFVFEGESPLYDQPADPRTANVFKPGVRGKTDQFVLKFRKP